MQGDQAIGVDSLPDSDPEHTSVCRLHLMRRSSSDTLPEGKARAAVTMVRQLLFTATLPCAALAVGASWVGDALPDIRIEPRSTVDFDRARDHVGCVPKNVCRRA